MANWDEIRKEWESSKITFKALSEKYGIPIGTIKSRRSREKWSRDKKVATNNKKDATPKKDATRKVGAPKGNKNAVGNRGGAAPIGNKNAVGNRGGRPPLGNKNAVTTGEYETIMWDYLDDEEKELFSSIETDPLYQIDITIRELSIRQRRMMKRIKRIEDGLTDKQRRVLQEMRRVKDVVTTHDEKTGTTKTVPIQRDQLTVTEIEETEFRAIDDILNLEEALTRITDKLLKANKQKFDMEQAFYHKQRMDEEKLDIERGKLAALQDHANKDENADDWKEALMEVAEKRRQVKQNE